jgi:hypothetical protein
MKGLSIVLKWKPNSPAVWSQKWLKGFFLCAGLVGIGVVAFLSLRSSPAISTVRWIPRFIANWADRHGRFDNFPAYGMMGVPFFMTNPTLRRQLWSIVILSLFIVSLELAQLAIPTRHCDIWDMFWGSMGLVAAWADCEVLKIFRINIVSKSEPVP